MTRRRGELVAQCRVAFSSTVVRAHRQPQGLVDPMRAGGSVWARAGGISRAKLLSTSSASEKSKGAHRRWRKRQRPKPPNPSFAPAAARRRASSVALAPCVAHGKLCLVHHETPGPAPTRRGLRTSELPPRLP